MKATQKLFLFIGILLALSCQKNSADIRSNFVNITVLNQQGQNLLIAPAVYDKNNIEVYNVIDGQAQLVNGVEKPISFSIVK